LCSALVAFSPLLIWYSQNARAYALLLLLLVLGLWMFARALHGDRRAIWWWGALSALALATHYFAIFTVVPEAAWLIFSRARDRDRVRDRGPRARDRSLWLAAALPVLMAAVLVPLLIHQDRHVARPWTVGYTIKDAVTGVAQEGLVGPTWTPLIHRAGVALTALFVLAGLVLLVHGRTHRGQAIVPLALLAVLIGLPLAGAIVSTNYLVIRNVIFAVPLMLMLVAAGCAYAARPALGAAVVGGLCAIGLSIAVAVPLTVKLHNADWRGADPDALRPRRPARLGVLRPLPEHPDLRGLPPAGATTRRSHRRRRRGRHDRHPPLSRHERPGLPPRLHAHRARDLPRPLADRVPCRAAGSAPRR